MPCGFSLTNSLLTSVDRSRHLEDVIDSSIVCRCCIIGQVLQNINLEDYLARTVPSLKDLQREISGGADLGALSLLRFAMQIIQRLVP